MLPGVPTCKVRALKDLQEAEETMKDNQREADTSRQPNKSNKSRCYTTNQHLLSESNGMVTLTKSGILFSNTKAMNVTRQIRWKIDY